VSVTAFVLAMIRFNKLSYQGDMRITLSSGLQVTVPNDQFMVPFVSVDRNGSRIFNESEREFLYGISYDEPAACEYIRIFHLTSPDLNLHLHASSFVPLSSE
jgi:hypothetical protein